MRGKEKQSFPVFCKLGITPAYAGKSLAAHDLLCPQQDHPRVCGEKGFVSGWKDGPEGSPPRMRGKDLLRRFRAAQHRITPAYAGKSLTGRTTPLPGSGSPPRMRGKVDGQLDIGVHAGITPAYAGKRPSHTFSLQLVKDHPRVCGEKCRSTLHCSLPFGGITPAYAGKSSHCDSVGTRVGITPAYAGKSRSLSTVLRTVLHAGITPAYAGKRLKRSRSTVSHVAIVPLFPSVCNKPVVSDGSPAGRDAPLFLPAENAVPASPAYNLRSL